MPLKGLVELVAPQLSRAAARMWATEPTITVYRNWLRTSYDLMRATTPLLRDAAAECERRRDRLSRTLAPYFAEQLVEEDGHEQWVVADFVRAGGDRRELLSRVAEPALARLAGAQYYWIRHCHPVALTGHIAMLEWHPPSADLVPGLMARTGLPAAAFETLTAHVELDAEHGPQLSTLLSQADIGAQQRKLLRTSALATAYGLIEAMHETAHRKEPDHGEAIATGTARI